MDPIESVRYNDFEISTNGISSHAGHGWKKVVYQNKTANRNPLRIKRRETEKTLPTETQLTAITSSVSSRSKPRIGGNGSSPRDDTFYG